MEGASLKIDQIEGRARCNVCDAEFDTETLFTACACGSRLVTRLQGEELEVKSMHLMEAS